MRKFTASVQCSELLSSCWSSINLLVIIKSSPWKRIRDGQQCWWRDCGWLAAPQGLAAPAKLIFKKIFIFCITTLSIDSDHLNCALYQTAMVHKELRFTLKSESAFMEILLENQFKVWIAVLYQKEGISYWKKRRNPPFLVLNPTLEDFLFIVGDQLERVDEAGGFVQGIARHHHKGRLGATNPNT